MADVVAYGLGPNNTPLPLQVDSVGCMLPSKYNSSQIVPVNFNIGPITNTTTTTLMAAAGAGIRNYITNLQIFNTSATIGSLIQIIDSVSTNVIWQGYVPLLGFIPPVDFITPLFSSPNSALQIKMTTTLTSTYVNSQGYQAP